MDYVRSMSRPATRFACLLLLASLFAFAQSDTASISGFVRDASRGVVPNVTVNVKNEATGAERKAVTNENGYYVVSSLPPGYYTVTVEAPGFKRSERSQNKLDPNIATTVDVDLQVGATSESINVIAESSAVQSESATLGRVVTTKEVAEMPLNGRNPLFLALLKPGVSGGALAQFSFDLTTGGLNINGGRTQDNLITYDGAVGVRTRSNGTSIGSADVDAVQEVQVLTSNYSPEYGRSSAGQIRIVTKSGGREFHGTAYEYFRNSALNANEWQRNRTVNQPSISGQAAPFRYNQFGWNFNGPLYVPKHFNSDKNKLFFLFSQEFTKFRREEFQQQKVPTDAMLRGDFGELLQPNQFFGTTPKYIKDPLKTGTCSAADQTACFPGNVIPASRLSPQGIALLNAFPRAIPGVNLGGNNWVLSPLRLDNQRKDTGAIDYLPKENHYIRFRVENYSLFHMDSNRGGTDRAPAQLDRPNQTASLNYIWTISPTVVNEFLLSASADHVRISVIPGKYQRSTYGINYPYIFKEKEIFDKIPTVNISNFVTLDGGPYPSSSAGPIYDLSDNITKIHGSHTFKFGGTWEYQGQNDFDQINVDNNIPGATNNQNGRFVFTDGRPGGSNLAIANAALGLFDTYSELGTRSYTPYRGNMFEFFAQDGWKATQKLHIDYGVRYTIMQPYFSLWRNMSVFDVASYDPAKAVKQDPRTGYILPGTGDVYNGLIIPGSGFTDAAKGRFPASTDPQYQRLFKGGKSYSQIHYNNIQPRIGIAYSLSDKTVVRAGAGRYFSRLGVSDSVFLGGNPPFQPTVAVTNGVVDTASGGAGGALNFPLVLTSQDPIFNNPESYQWNTTVQHEFRFGTTVEVAYVGRRALHQQRERNINAVPLGTIQANPGINVDYLRPYKGYSTIRVTNNDGNALYNGLQLGLTKRYSKGMAFGLAYTLSKSSDDGSTQRDVIPNPFDRSMLWGPSTYDRRHVFVGNVIYELPFWKNQKGVLASLLGGWQVSMITQIQTGSPFTVGTTDDIAGFGPGNGTGAGTAGNNDVSNNSMPTSIYNISGDPHLSDPKFATSAADPNLYFNTAAFQRPAAGTFTTQRNRDLLYNPGFQNWTGALYKQFKIGERQMVKFRSEFYNFPNHPNWNNVDGNPTSGTFGKVTNKNFERTIQLSLRYEF
jgi:hypothetical protein